MPTSNTEGSLAQDSLLRAAKYCWNIWSTTKDFDYYQAYMKLYWLGTAVPEADDFAEVVAQINRRDALPVGD